MGEEYVATARVSTAPDGTERRTEIGRNTAHTAYQMRRALTLQSEAIRAAAAEAGAGEAPGRAGPSPPP
jgi:hypothetical protein